MRLKNLTIPRGLASPGFYIQSKVGLLGEIKVAEYNGLYLKINCNHTKEYFYNLIELFTHTLKERTYNM